MVYNIFSIGVTIKFVILWLNACKRYTITTQITIILHIEKYASILLNGLYDNIIEIYSYLTLLLLYETELAVSTSVRSLRIDIICSILTYSYEISI